MHNLYPHQSDILQRSAVALFKDKEILIQSPTGSGKSVLISTIAKRAIVKNKTVLVLSETTKIYNQLVKECQAIEINSGVKHIYIMPGKCYVAMAQTLQNRPKIIEQFRNLGENLILMPDEAHIGRMNKVIEALKGCLLAGFTATPHYKFAKHLPILYKSLVVGPQVDDLIQSGHLCSYDHIARTNADLSILRKQGGEYTELSQEQAFGTSKVYDGLYEDLRTVPFKKCVIFVASIKDCETTYEKLIEHGFKACRYHSNTSILPFPSYELAKFTELDECNIVVTVSALTKGWDHKPIDLVVLKRKTTSTILYLQMLGRGSRIIPGEKEFFRVLDYGENFVQHDYYYTDRDWDRLWKEDKKKKNDKLGVAAITSCTNCQALIPVSSRKCPYCMFEFPEQLKELQQGELVNVTAAYNGLVGKTISQLSPQELATYAKLKNKKPYAARIARAQEQKQKGWLRKFSQAMGYNDGWMVHQVISEEPIEFYDIVLK